MNETFRTLLDKVYSVPERKFVWINIVLAGFVAFAHGGALAVTYAKPTPDAAEIRQLALISLPIVVIVILTAAVALVYAKLRPTVLALHGVILAVGESLLLFWALGLLVHGIPEGRFAWSVGFLTASACYAAILFCRFSIPLHLRSSRGVYYAPIFAVACAAPVDIGVFLRVVG